MKNRWSTITHSPAIHLLHFIDLWHHRNVFELQKILISQTNVHVSRNPTICDQKLPMPWRAFVRKNALVPVLLYKLALYESLIYEVARRREAMKFAPAKKFFWIWWQNHPPASIFHEIFKNPNFHARCSGHFPGFPCRSHVPFQQFMTPPERIRVPKNTGSANDFAHFEKIYNMQPKNTITT